MSPALAPHLWFHLVPQPLRPLHCLMPEAAVIYSFSFSAPAEPGFLVLQEGRSSPSPLNPPSYALNTCSGFLSLFITMCECYAALENKILIEKCSRKEACKRCRRAECGGGGRGEQRGQCWSVCVWRQRYNTTVLTSPSFRKDLSVVGCYAPYRVDMKILHWETSLISRDLKLGSSCRKLHIPCLLDTSSWGDLGNVLDLT